MRKDEDEKPVCIEDQSQLVLDKRFSFEDYVECDTSIAATLSVQELHSASIAKDEEEDSEESPALTPSFGDTRIVFGYMCNSKNNA